MLALRHDVVAGRAQAEHHPAEGGHARRRGQGGLGPLEGRHRLLELLHGRAAEAQ